MKPKWSQNGAKIQEISSPGTPRRPRGARDRIFDDFGSFLDSVLGPVAPKFEHFSRPDFYAFSARRPEQNLGDFGSILEPILKAFFMFLDRGGNSVF